MSRIWGIFGRLLDHSQLADDLQNAKQLEKFFRTRVYITYSIQKIKYEKINYITYSI